MSSIGNLFAYELHLFGRFCASQKVSTISRNVFLLLDAVSLILVRYYGAFCNHSQNTLTIIKIGSRWLVMISCRCEDPTPSFFHLGLLMCSVIFRFKLTFYKSPRVNTHDKYDLPRIWFYLLINDDSMALLTNIIVAERKYFTGK